MAFSKKQEHELLKRYFNNPNILKTFLKGQNLTWTNNVYAKFGEVIGEVTQEIELELMEAQEREEKRLALIALIEEQGWNLKDLMGKSTVKKSGEPSKKAAKYRFTDENGNERFWSGFGMKPKALQALLSQGHQLEEFLIVNESVS